MDLLIYMKEGKNIRGHSNTPVNEQTKDQWKVIFKIFVRK